MALQDVVYVIEFLRENGFERAASALWDEAAARDDGSGERLDLAGESVASVCGGDEADLLRLRPLKFGIHDGGDGRRSGSKSSSSTGAFLSMASSPSEFTNPYGLRPALCSRSQDSSERLSQFGTARDYHDPNLFTDAFWEVPLSTEDPASAFLEGDMFIESVQEEDPETYPSPSDLAYESDSPPHVDSAEKSRRGIIDEEHPSKELHQCDPQEDWEAFNLRIIHPRNRTGFEENKDFPVVVSSVIAGRYYVTEHLGSATFSKVVQARDLLTGVDVCLKIIKNDKEFFDQSLDEIKLLKLVNMHDPADEHHILRLYDYFYYKEHLFIVSELLRANLYEFQKLNENSGGEIYFTLARIQTIARQCLEGLKFLHGLGIIHCDLKPENILIKSYRRCKIKIIDLGSSCFRTDSLCLYVQSRSYRAPEVILGLPYDEKIDIWSLGCVLAELFTGEVLFPNDELVRILARMVEIFGGMDPAMVEQARKYMAADEVERITPGSSPLSGQLGSSDPLFIGFLGYLLQTNPQKRPTAEQALRHPWFAYRYQ